MSKYRKHYASKYEFPTVQVKTPKTTVVPGHKKAKRVIEDRLKRPLHEDTKVVTRGGNWCFLEPRLTIAPPSA